MESIELIVNEERKRFEFQIEGYTAFIEYLISKDNVMFLTHTSVPKQLEGKGIGSKIVLKALSYVKDNNYKLAPLCPFVAKYLVKHTEWQELLAPGYHVSK